MMDKINDKTKRDDLLKKLTVMDFVATDLHLYLNTHPNDSQALKMFNDCVSKSAEVRKEYENHFGPLVGFRTQDSASWRWSDCPWPWEADFNFKWDEKTVHHGEERL